MRYGILITFLFNFGILTAQINSEESYFFSDDIDTILLQLHKNEFSDFSIEITNKNASKENRRESFQYQRLNDTLLRVTTNEYVQYYHFQHDRYDALDSLMHPYTFPNQYSIRKDSANFRVLYLYDISKDTILSQYIRAKNDTQGRFIYNYVYNPQSKSGQEIEVSYPNDSTTITNNSIFDAFRRQLLSSDTTTTNVFTNGNLKIITQNSKSRNGSVSERPQYFFTTSHSTKTIQFDEKRRIISVIYRTKSSNYRKEKATMTVTYEKN